MTAAWVDQQHTAIIEGIRDQLRDVLEGSRQGIYIYLDDDHKTCNTRFASMLGYDSPDAWAEPGAFTVQYVEPASQQALVSTYRHAMEHQAAGTVEVTWKAADGRSVPSSVILVPIAYGDALLALHFITAHE
jgi:PAS domain-containing protein